MTRKDTYRDQLKREFTTIIDSLTLNDLYKNYLRLRWLDQVIWMEGKADNARSRYYTFRVIAIIGGLIVPALVSLNLAGRGEDVLRILTIILSLVVAISTAVEGFFHYGERWRHYRSTVEILKLEGWRFFRLSGGYGDYRDHEIAFKSFSDQIETTFQRDIETYTEITKEKGYINQSS
jgi:hypothetical protein